MTNRSLLAKNKIKEFTNFMIDKGWKQQQPKGQYEEARFKLDNKTMIIYNGKSSEHFSIEDKWEYIINDFIHGKYEITPVNMQFGKYYVAEIKYTQNNFKHKSIILCCDDNLENPLVHIVSNIDEFERVRISDLYLFKIICRIKEMDY